MTSRRTVLLGSANGIALAASGLLGRLARADLPRGALDAAALDTLPGKQPLLRRSFRPPNYETPLAAFNDVITPNDRFFVRWHLAIIPQIDLSAWRLDIAGDAATQPLQLSMDQLM